MNEKNKGKEVGEKEEAKVGNNSEIIKENKGKNYSLGILVSLLTGLFAGFIVGIIIAPKPGKDIRKDIKDKSEEFLKKSKESVTDTIDKTKEFVEKGKSKFEKVKEAIIPKKTEDKKEKSEK